MSWSVNVLVLVCLHYSDVIMSPMASQITSFTIVYSTGFLSADHRKHQRFASLAFERGIHRWPVSSRQKGPVTRKMFSFDDVIMVTFSAGNVFFYYSRHLSVPGRSTLTTPTWDSSAQTVRSLAWWRHEINVLLHHWPFVGSNPLMDGGFSYQQRVCNAELWFRLCC